MAAKSCRAFSAVGVVEAMTRIEHCAWSLRSAGFYWTVECKRDGPFAATVTMTIQGVMLSPHCPCLPTQGRQQTPTWLSGTATMNAMRVLHQGHEWPE